MYIYHGTVNFYPKLKLLRVGMAGLHMYIKSRAPPMLDVLGFHSADKEEDYLEFVYWIREMEISGILTHFLI